MNNSSSTPFGDCGGDIPERSTSAESEIEQTLRRSKPGPSRIDFSVLGEALARRAAGSESAVSAVVVGSSTVESASPRAPKSPSPVVSLAGSWLCGAICGGVATALLLLVMGKSSDASQTADRSMAGDVADKEHEATSEMNQTPILSEREIELRRQSFAFDQRLMQIVDSPILIANAGSWRKLASTHAGVPMPDVARNGDLPLRESKGLSIGSFELPIEAVPTTRQELLRALLNDSPETLL